MSSPSVQPSTKWVPGFVRFLNDATKVKGTKAFYEIITLDPTFGRRIGLGGGIKDKIPPFIGLQPFDAIWFVEMPWLEMILERNAMVFIADPGKSGLNSSLFGIRIMISPDYATVLSRFREMDVRRIEVDSSGAVKELAPNVLTRLPLTIGKVERLGARPKITRGAF